MSLFTIDCLNKDELLEIFEYLEAKSLKQAALVCKQWDSIIGSSTTTMKKLPLAFRGNWKEKQTEIEGLCRSFHSIILDEISITDDTLPKMLESLAHNTRYFEMDVVTINLELLPQILSCLKAVEKILVKDFTVLDPKDSGFLPLSTLKTLKSLVFVNSDFRFISCLNVSQTQVNELRISHNSTEGNFLTFETFLQLQTNLETLCIRIQQSEALQSLANYNATQKAYNFKLKKLAIDFKHWGTDQSANDAFLNFMKIHQSTLEELEIEQNLSEEVLEYVMKNLRVKRLIIDANRFPTKPLFFNSIRPNIYLKTLAIKGLLSNINVVRGILTVYQHIQKLAIYNWNDEIANDSLLFVANNLKSLNYIEIPCLTTETPELAIASLKTLYVDFVGNAVEYQNFCVNNPSIERLVVKWTTARDIFTYEIIERITQSLPNLKSLTFGAYFNPSTRILEMMSRYCRHHQTIELLQEKEGAQVKPNLNFGQLSVRYYPQCAVKAVFKDIRDSSLWVEDDLNDIDSDLDSDVEFSDDDEISDGHEYMNWDDGDDSDMEQNQGIDLAGMIRFFQR